MTLEEGRQFLAGEGIPYTELNFENENRYWAEVSCWNTRNQGRDEPVTVLRIEAPNGRRHLDMEFLGGEFLDLWFGGFSFELWESEDLRGDLLYYIRQIMAGQGWCAIAVDLKTERFAGDGYFPVEEGNITFQEELQWRYAPKTAIERLFRAPILHELYDWNEYHRIER